MKTRYALELAFKGVRAKPSRTFLTLLGIAIGIAAVMLISSLGRSAKDLILNEIRVMGTDLFVVQAGRRSGGTNDLAEAFLSTSLKERDLEALRRPQNAPHIREASPLVTIPGTATYGTETAYPEIIGCNASFIGNVFNVLPVQGLLYGEQEIRQKMPIAVIGSKVKEDLFGNNEALGEKITIKGVKFRVTGVLPKKGQVGFLNLDDAIFIPYTTAQTYLLGSDHYFQIMIRVDDPSNIARTTRDVEATLRENHRLEDGQEDDFKIRTPEALMEQVGTILSIFTIFLSGVVAIALVVGGIGTMNIMLVSVTERTKEIGLRKAIGAQNKDVLTQFLYEAVLLTSLGGVVGVLVGGFLAYGISALIRTYTDYAWVYAFPYSAAFLALGFSASIGLVFGLYPAYKASQKSPMEALRYE